MNLYRSETLPISELCNRSRQPLKTALFGYVKFFRRRSMWVSKKYDPNSGLSLIQNLGWDLTYNEEATRVDSIYNLSQRFNGIQRESPLVSAKRDGWLARACLCFISAIFEKFQPCGLLCSHSLLYSFSPSFHWDCLSH